MENPIETLDPAQESSLEEQPQIDADAAQDEPTGDPKPKKRAGRPRNDKMPVASAADPTTHLIPSPRFREFKPGAVNPGQTSSAGCNYWRNLPGWAKDQVVAYVYRTHPVLKLSPADEENDELVGTNPNIDKLSGVENIEDEQDLLNRFGCGDYHIRLNDTKRQPNAQTVCTIYFKGVGGADYRSSPPTDKRIGDIEQVDLNHPANAGYVAYLRGAGKLPEQSKKAEAEAEMATIELTKELLKQNERLHEKNTREPSQPAVSPADIVSVARDLAKDMAGANARDPQLTAVLEKLTEAVSSKNQGMNLAEVIPLLTALMGNRGSGDAELTQARAQNMELLMQMLRNEQERTKTEQERTRALESRLEARIAAPAPATSSITDSVEALRKMREVVEEFTGPKGAEANPVEEAARDAAPKWLRPFLPLVQPLAQAAIGAWMMRAQQGQQPMMPGNVPQGFPQQQPNPAQQMQQQPSLPAPQQQPAAAPVQNTYGFPPELAYVMTAIEHPLKTYLFQERSGTEFAEWYAEGNGVAKFKQLAGYGPEQILAVLQAWPPIASAISGMDVQVVQKFVQDFVETKFDEEPVPAA